MEINDEMHKALALDAKKLEDLEAANDALDLDIYIYDQLLSDKVAIEALHLLIGRGYSADEVRLALEKIAP